MRFLIILVLICLTSVHCDDDDALLMGWLDKQIAEQESPTEDRQKPETVEPISRRGPCTTPDNKPGICMKPSECDKIVEKVDPQTFTIRAAGCHYLLECCPRQSVRITNRETVPQTNTGCGWSNPAAHVFKEVAQAYADYGDFPWMVAMLKKTSSSKWSKKNYLGGAALIHQKVVMTVAHRVEGKSAKKIKCRAGEWDTKTDNEIYPYQEQDVHRIIIHEDYSRSNVHNNIALLVMKKPFTLVDAPHMGLACIGRNLPAPGTFCYSMGWGADFNERDKFAVVLKKLRLPLVESNQCQRNLRETDLGRKYTLHSSYTCAGGEDGVDTCVGDGGSPLVCPIRGSDDATRYAVFGLVAFGSNVCGEKDVPGVYVNVPEMANWIDEQMEEEGFGKDSYEY